MTSIKGIDKMRACVSISTENMNNEQKGSDMGRNGGIEEIDWRRSCRSWLVDSRDAFSVGPLHPRLVLLSEMSETPTTEELRLLTKISSEIARLTGENPEKTTLVNNPLVFNKTEKGWAYRRPSWDLTNWAEIPKSLKELSENYLLGEM